VSTPETPFVELSFPTEKTLELKLPGINLGFAVLPLALLVLRVKNCAFVVVTSLTYVFHD